MSAPLTEFTLIQRFFTEQTVKNPTTHLGIGDDCALLSIPSGYELAVTTDTMVAGVHFFADADPEGLGHKLLAVNLSDLASMGAQPLSVTLALTLPQVDESWLAAFSRGFFNLAQCFNVDLIGGDTTQGETLTLTVHAMGLVPRGQALLRSKAQQGDLIYLTGELGDAGLGLKILQGYTACEQPEFALARLQRPMPQVAMGIGLIDVAHACIDISDGLSRDLGHILHASNVGACLHWNDLPLSSHVKQYIVHTGDWQLPLRAGDDYELCFTVPVSQRALVPAGCHLIGAITADLGLHIIKDQQHYPLSVQGYEHFS